jgi:predicted methyltransferase
VLTYKGESVSAGCSGTREGMARLTVLSHRQAELLAEARRATGQSAVISLDLGLSTVEVQLEEDGVRLPTGRLLAWEEIEAIQQVEQRCFVVEEDGLRKAQVFSEYTNRVYILMPTSAAPTMLLSGIPMHRIKGTDPYRDTLSKVRTIRPVVGRVLDTATGLGYTAIEAAKTADRVVTIELDPAVLELARLNPWSQALFENPAITQIVGDSVDEIQDLEDASFSRILHDPPAFSLAGDLYSGSFYRELYRVLERGGRVFHYIGDLERKSGRNVARGAARRLQAAGFRRVRQRPEAFGLVAYK